MENEIQSTQDVSQARLIYILYLAGLVFGITGLIGVVMAYISKDDAPQWLKSHYQFQIRTFWMGLLYLFIVALLTTVFIGWLVGLFWAVWLIVRCVKGLKALKKQQPPENLLSWMF